MKKFLGALFLIASASAPASAQYLHLLHEVDFPTITNQYGVVGGSDCWGWKDSMGTEYAIMGNLNTIAFVRASDGVVLDEVAAPTSSDPYYHRDMKTMGHYAYIVGECKGANEGMTIVDLSPLPDSVRFVSAWTNGGTLVRSHNISIDEAKGFAYLESDEFQSAHGVEIVDINNPENPVKVGFLNTPGVHDMMARNDTVWVAEGSVTAYSVWDCSDKGNPTLIGRVFDPTFGYCHNIWPSDDGKFFFTAEETGNKTVKVWDASDMQNITLRGQYLGPNNLVHNVHVEGNLLFMSHYTSGVRVVDWTDPDFPVEIASYDTYPANNNNTFHGCWGVYPHSDGGYVYGSTMEGQLFIFEWLPTAVSNTVPMPEKGISIWPNPATTVANIKLELTQAEHVTVKVIDLQGRVVASLLDSDLGAGTFTLPWHVDGSLPAGSYQVVVKQGDQTELKTVSVVR